MQEFLDALREEDPDCFARYDFARSLIEENGPAIGHPHWGALGDGLGEIRWRCDKRRFRIYCGSESGRTIVMYAYDLKKWGAFPNDTRKLCLRRQKDYQSDDYDYEARYMRFCDRQKPTEKQ